MKFFITFYTIFNTIHCYWKGAIILLTNSQTSRPEIFATQRGYGDFKGGWEIPGGKLEPGETPEQCIVYYAPSFLVIWNFWNMKQLSG